jgi:hypothetical protein
MCVRTGVDRIYGLKNRKTCTITAGYNPSGGDEGIRTLDLCVANAPLSHLSYIPTQEHCNICPLYFNNNFMVHPANEYQPSIYHAHHQSKMAATGFRSDRREAFVISVELRSGGPPGSRPEWEGEQRRGEASPVRNSLSTGDPTKLGTLRSPKGEAKQ